MDQQIAAIRAALAALESSIAQTQSALATATVPDDIAALRSALVDLKAERAQLQLQLANLEAAAVEVAPLALRRATMAGGSAGARVGVPKTTTTKRRTQMKALEKQLKSTLVDRSVAKATLAAARKVMTHARRLRTIDEPASRGSKKKKKAV